MRIIGVLDNLRSLANVGSIFRSADSLGVAKLYLCGTTGRPHPTEPWRVDHQKLRKTALGAELHVAWKAVASTETLLRQLKTEQITIVAFESTPDAQPLPTYVPDTDRVAIVVGNEVTGLTAETLAHADAVVRIPMLGTKESLNVSVAFGIAAFWLANHQPAA